MNAETDGRTPTALDACPPTDAAELPVLDISAFLADEFSDAAQDFVDELREVCHRVGFCHLTGHGVPDELHERLLTASRTFFAQPHEQRMEIAMDRSPHFRGYTPFKGERTNGTPDLRDEIDFGPERIALDPHHHPWDRLVGPNQFPTSVPALEPALLEWQRRMDGLGRAVLRAVERALGQAPGALARWFDPVAEDTIKLIRYASPGLGEETDQGVGRHRDFGMLTFVLQDGVPGLEVERDGEYLAVEPRPGAFVMNLGEMLQLITQGFFKATVHRVTSPPPGVERFSAVYFFNPSLDASLSPLALSAELAAGAPGGASDDEANPILATYGENILKVRLRAHPSTAAIHHPDLLEDAAHH